MSRLRDDHSLLTEASQWPHAPDLDDLTPTLLTRLTSERGVDFATAVLYDRLVRRPDTRALISRYQAESGRQAESGGSRPAPGGRLVIVPGVLYHEYPHTGADGRVIRDEAARHGWETDLVPLPSTGSPHESGRVLCNWLTQQPPSDLVLVSLSKGGADVKAALARDEAAQAFARVRGWINLGGILEGSPMAEWICTRRIARTWYRALFRLTGHDFGVFAAMRRSPAGTLDFPLQIPSGMSVLHVVGVPLLRHLSSRRARRWHRRLSRWGPNDSVTLLSDVSRWPGRLFPVWGTDHYLQHRWDPQRLVPFLLTAISEEAAAVPA